MDRGAWWATVRRDTKNWTQLKWLSINAVVVKVKSDVKKKYCLRTWHVLKRERNQRSNCQHSLDHRESKGTPKPLYCLLRNPHAGQKATVRTRYGTTDWFQMGKGVHQGYKLSPCLFNFYAGYIMKNSGLDESQVGIRIVRTNITTSHLQNGRNWRGTKESLVEGERGEWKSWVNTQETKIWHLVPTLYGK